MTAKGPETAVDFAYLEGFMAGDAQVIGEVLTLFGQQAALWRPRLEAPDRDWAALVHTIKGAASGIGANRLARVCAAAEADGGGDLGAVRQALAEALEAIAAYRAA
jgi:HPt (histidine-containing phosphotransfer) domain-containing protein